MGEKEYDKLWSMIIRFATQAAAAVLHLHKEHILHNDVMARHLLLDEHYNVKLKGFQLAMPATEGAPMLSKFIPHVTPPETLDRGTCTTMTDVYRFGMLLWELGYCCQRYPYGRDTPLAHVVAQISAGTLPHIPEHWPVLYRSLIRSCLALDFKSRPEMASVYEELKGLHEIWRARDKPLTPVLPRLNPATRPLSAFAAVPTRHSDEPLDKDKEDKVHPTVRRTTLATSIHPPGGRAIQTTPHISTSTGVPSTGPHLPRNQSFAEELRRAVRLPYASCSLLIPLGLSPLREVIWVL